MVGVEEGLREVVEADLTGLAEGDAEIEALEDAG